MLRDTLVEIFLYHLHTLRDTLMSYSCNILLRLREVSTCEQIDKASGRWVLIQEYLNEGISQRVQAPD